MSRGTLLLAGLAIAVFLVTLFVSMGTVGVRRLDDRVPAAFPDADPGRGRALIVAHGCGACHVVPGIAGADGLVGPPLTGIARRHYIAGTLATTPENLARWIQAPQAIEPGTAMPNLDLSGDEARDIAAYLYERE